MAENEVRDFLRRELALDPGDPEWRLEIEKRNDTYWTWAVTRQSVVERGSVARGDDGELVLDK